MVLVRIPAILRSLTGGKPEVWIEANTIEELLQRLSGSRLEWRGLRARIIIKDVCDREEDRFPLGRSERDGGDRPERCRPAPSLRAGRIKRGAPDPSGG